MRRSVGRGGRKRCRGHRCSRRRGRVRSNYGWGVPTEPGRTRNCGAGTTREGWSTSVREQRRGEVREDRVSMEESERVGVRLRWGISEDRVRNATSVGYGEVTPNQSLTSCAFTSVR